MLICYLYNNSCYWASDTLWRDALILDCNSLYERYTSRNNVVLDYIMFMNCKESWDILKFVYSKFVMKWTNGYTTVDLIDLLILSNILEIYFTISPTNWFKKIILSFSCWSSFSFLKNDLLSLVIDWLNRSNVSDNIKLNERISVARSTFSKPSVYIVLWISVAYYNRFTPLIIITPYKIIINQT
jgi:hypothetical protein